MSYSNRVLGGQYDFDRATPKRIELSFKLCDNGRFIQPNSDKQWDEIRSLFPTTFGMDFAPPFLIIRVRKLPPRPWPLTVAGMAVRLTTKLETLCFKRGWPGYARLKALEQFGDLRHEEFSEEILNEALRLYTEVLKIAIREIQFWGGALWQVTVPDGTDKKKLPAWLGKVPVDYRYASEVPRFDPSALRDVVPNDTVFDDSSYLQSPDRILRPGIMVSSANEQHPLTTGTAHRRATSGIMVVDKYGEPFITVPSHLVPAVGDEIYHPTPNGGQVIGTAVSHLEKTDISIVKLKPGIRYINETFETPEGFDGTLITGFAPVYNHKVQAGDTISMNNQYNGFCEGLIMSVGKLKIENTNPRHNWATTRWLLFENGDEPKEGSCGSAILTEGGEVVGFFWFQSKSEEGLCYSIAADELRSFDYEICGGTVTF